jgi:hypothetical protein
MFYYADTDSSREGTPSSCDVVQRGRFIIRPLSPEVQQSAVEVQQQQQHSGKVVHTSAVESVLLQNQQVTDNFNMLMCVIGSVVLCAV